jgi:uncharacterized protein YcnI
VSRHVTTPAPQRSGGRVTRGLAVAALLMAAVAVAAPAAAHVTVTPSTTQAGAQALVEVSVGHGCEGSATTAVEIRIPDAVYSVTPTRNPLWELSVEKEPVVPPVTDEHGARITDRVASVTYRTDTPLPDGQRDTFQLALRLPGEAGRTLVFPTIQTCEKGESAWIEVPAAGQDPEDLDLPAPAFVVTAAGPSSASRPSNPSTSSDPSTASPASGEVTLVAGDESSSSAGSSLLALAALGVGVIGVVLGLTVLARQRRQP